MTNVGPVKNNDREFFLDALRGFAIIGIFIANMASFSFYDESAKIVSPWIVADFDHTMRFLHDFFIEGKFYSIFSLLFGWGIALQIKRGQAKGIDALPTIKRRLLFMLLLGAAHLLIWFGDIVFLYALIGFVLLLFLKLSNKTLLISSILLILSPVLLYGLKMNIPLLNYPSELFADVGRNVREHLIGNISKEARITFIKNASWFDHLKRNIGAFFFRYSNLIFVSRIPKVLGMFLLGYLIGRTDFYKNLAQNKKIVYWIIGIGLLIGLPANYQLAKYMADSQKDYYDLKLGGWYRTIAYALGVAPLALAYVGLLMLSFKTKVGRKFLLLFSPVGKMAFSNYFMQSLIGNYIFLGAGLGYMQKVGPLYYTFLALLIFIMQIIYSTIWLKYFQFGPIEWVWRSLTYGKKQPFLQ